VRVSILHAKGSNGYFEGNDLNGNDVQNIPFANASILVGHAG